MYECTLSCFQGIDEETYFLSLEPVDPSFNRRFLHNYTARAIAANDSAFHFISIGTRFG